MPSEILGLSLREDSWLCWQIDDAIDTWGEFIEALIAENNQTDKHGRILHHHNVKKILGYENEDPAFNMPELSEMEVAEYLTNLETKSSLDSSMREDGSVMVDVDPDIKANKKFMDPRELGEIKYESTPWVKNMAPADVPYESEDINIDELTTIPAPMSDEEQIIEARRKYTDRQMKAKKVNMPDDWDDTKFARPKMPDEWDDDKAERPDTPEDWNDTTNRPGGKDPRGRRGNHRYRRGGNFTVGNEGKLIFDE